MKTRTLGILAGAAAAGLAALAVAWHADAARAREELDRSKDEFAALARMKKKAAELKLKNPRPAAGAASTDDLLTFISAKSRQAGVPHGLMNITRNPDAAAGGWKEVSYTVALRAPKDAPLSRASFADFVRLVEEERPSVRSKNLSLALAGDGLSSASVTFSAFTR